ncbi:MAG: Crp/Fnr family transcriptional regulator [Devosia sp.]
MDSTIDNAALLAKCALFQPLPEAERGLIAAKAHRRRYARGDVIFRIGDVGDSLMVVVSGRIRITLPDASGRDIILTDLVSGDVFGEIAMLDGEGRSADATSLAVSEVLVLERSHMLTFLAARPELCLKLLVLLSARLRKADERMADLAAIEVEVRLAKTLLKWLQGGANPVTLTQSELADTVVASREAVNRQLAAWQRRGVVAIRDGHIHIAQPKALADIAGAL